MSFYHHGLEQLKYLTSSATGIKYGVLFSAQKHLNDEYLLLAVGIMVAPALVLLIVQASIYPVTLHKQATINKVRIIH